MARSKVALKLIENESARKSSYKKRKEGLRKKMEELSVLCDVKGCMLLYNAEVDGEYIWPSHDEAEALLLRFERLPRSEQTKKMLNHDEFMKNRVEKLKDEVIKQELKNKKMAATILIHKIMNRRGMVEIKEVEEARVLIWFADQKLQEIHKQRVLFPPLPPPPSAPQDANPADPYLTAMMSAYARSINPNGHPGAGSSGTKDDSGF